MLCGQEHGCGTSESGFFCLSFDFGRRIRLGKLIYLQHKYAQPSGAATPRNSDAHKRIAVPKALCVLRERPRPRPKSGKVCCSDTRPGDVCERAERSEGSDTTPIRNAPCFAVWAVVCDPLSKAECVHAFACESERGPFVRKVEKRDERWSEIELLLIVGSHREPGNVCI